VKIIYQLHRRDATFRELYMSIFGTDGVRGKVGVYPITPDFALKLGWAAGKVLAKGGAKKVIVGKDTRNSGYMFESAIQSGLSAAGVDALLTGPLPTPGIAYLTKTLRASAGVVISASHNHYGDNGIKFFSAEGEKLSDAVQEEIERELNNTITCVSPQDLGKSYRLGDATGRYIEFCKSTFPSSLSLAGLTIVVDSANGAGYKSAPAVFEELGAKVHAIANSPNGFNINDGCGATDVNLLSSEVIKRGADLGLAIDGDGDRIIFVDHTGAVRDGDHLLYIIASHLKEKNQLNGGVVGTYMSNMGLENAFKSLGIPFARAKVGDRYVMEQLRRRGWELGGESSGHIICGSKLNTGDGTIAALQVLVAIVETGHSMKSLCSSWEPYPQSLINIGFGDTSVIPVEHKSVKTAVAHAEKALGFGSANPSGRVLLRKSGTERLVRVMVEAKDSQLSEYWASEIALALRAVS
jgi:phosphoglucosamine mutase